jgi:hypothetical protein
MKEVRMTMRRKDFLLLVTLATAVATSALGQGASNAAAGSPTQSTAIPDFSGAWSYMFCCGFQPPLSGPGPVANVARRYDASDRYQYVGDYTNPILKPVAAQIVKRHGEVEATGVPLPTPRNHCWPEGVPFMFSDFGIQILQEPDTVTILYDHDHQVRRVRMNASHPAQVTPSWYGDSVGHYDGDTLVIDTVGMKIGRYSMIDWYGTPYTPALHVVERYRLIDDAAAKAAEERGVKVVGRVTGGDGLWPDPAYKGKALQLVFTVEDPGVFTMPWSASITRRRSTNEWPEFVCVENPHGYFPGKHADVPTADRSVF